MYSSKTLTNTFEQFLDLSSQIGNDILKTQGAGGNTSLKAEGVMWIKASGTWLAHAKERDIMVPVLAAPLVDALRSGDSRADKATDFIVGSMNTSSLRPSIETSFHAALPSRVVAHYHCVNTIALAVLEQREKVLAARMAKIPDLKWEMVPYRRPGTPLARQIEKIAHRTPDVLILFNHGIIVTGDTAEDVAGKIGRVSAALATDPRSTGAPDIAALSAIAKDSAFRPAPDMESHKTALSPLSMAYALGGSLYPDHVIFLGTELGVVDPEGSIEAVLNKYRNRNKAAPKLLLVPGKGILLSNELAQGGEVMARCLAEVTARIPEGEKIAYLSEDDEHQLNHWEAEQYRQTLDRRAPAVFPTIAP